ncbi:MAG: hypothetical protein ACREVE_15735 [Gammaproteobacteria bacterium]
MPTNRRLPAMLLLLMFGAGAALIQSPALAELAAIEITMRLPSWALGGM